MEFDIMQLVLSQRIDYKSDYKDIPFKVYHYPKRYRNQIKTGDTFVYYQGDRYKKENRYYFGCGLVGKITPSDDGEHYYAEVINGIKFSAKVPIYNPAGGFYESIGYEKIREKVNPAWQNSVRKISEEAFKTILGSANLNFKVVNELLNLEVDDYITKEDKGLLRSFSGNLREKEVEDLFEHATENDIEKILLKLDGSGSVELRHAIKKVRKASRKTITALKEIYNHTCQICEVNHNEKYGVNVVEAHHIDYFSKSQNHQPNNIVILCPTHHRLIHSGKAIFDRQRSVFIYENGYEEVLKLNKHL